MKISLRQLRVAGYLAGGFVATRLIYAIVFGGANAPGFELFQIPEVGLAGPFRHITLFGSVTSEGLWQNLQAATPFALTIFITGFITSLIRPSQLFTLAKKTFVGHQLVIAIAIGWAQLPSLVEASKRVRLALKLRGERPHKVVVPVLETAATRALAIATRISVEQTKSVPNPSLIVYKLQVGEVFVPELRVKPGELFCITGQTGSGKTNLLLALSGLAGELGIAVRGSISAQGSIGFLPQQPRDSIWGPRTSDEVHDLVAVGFEDLANQEVHHLSEGEAVRMVFERELSRQPQILLIDEPFASLDQSASEWLSQRLRDYLASGGMAIVVEHKTEYLESMNPNWYQISDRSLRPGLYKAQEFLLQRSIPVVGSDLIFDKEIKEILVGERTLLQPVQVRIHQGQAISISGPNGSGKTSLLKAILADSKPHQVAMVPEVVSDFFVTQSLSEELARADRTAGVTKGFTRSSFDSICSELDINLDTHPRDLSHGTQLALAIAMQLSHKPQLLLIDEPVKGFDPATRCRVAETLKCVLETGTAIIFATHDLQFASALAHEHLVIADQKLRREGRVLQ